MASRSFSVFGIASKLSLLSLDENVEFAFLLLTSHSPSKLGLCSCFVRQLDA